MLALPNDGELIPTLGERCCYGVPPDFTPDLSGLFFADEARLDARDAVLDAGPPDFDALRPE